jgi:hypothetical protein
MNEIAKPVEMRHILAIQENDAKLPQFNFELMHHFTKGAYLRQLFMPKGSRVVGKRHRHQHALIVAGHIEIGMDGEPPFELRGFHVIDSMPGVKRVIVALSDSYLCTVHITEETDLAAIEAHVVMPDEGDAT